MYIDPSECFLMADQCDSKSFFLVTIISAEVDSHGRASTVDWVPCWILRVRGNLFCCYRVSIIEVNMITTVVKLLERKYNNQATQVQQTTKTLCNCAYVMRATQWLYDSALIARVNHPAAVHESHKTKVVSKEARSRYLNSSTITFNVNLCVAVLSAGNKFFWNRQKIMVIN